MHFHHCFAIIRRKYAEEGGLAAMKRTIGLILAIAVLISVVAVGVSAETVLATSDEAIRILKLEEGFSKTPYWDYAQWTVGYGTKCPDDKLEEYRQNGISEEEAELLLRTYITKFESEIHGFMIRTGTQLNQNQFDALLLFSYNCGSGWSYETSGGLYNAIVSGATGNQLIDAFSRWCNAGGQIKTFLLRRRLCEANIYLNAEYSQTAPANFGYVLYDACGGTTSPNVQGYHTELTSAIRTNPVYEGYTFAGWFTARSGGTEVKVLDASVRNARLYARWKDSQGNETVDKPENGVTVTVTANDVNVRKGPGTNHAVVSSVSTGEQLVITEVQEGSGYTWGKFSGGWVCLKYTNYDIVKAPAQEGTPTTGKRMGTVKVNDTLRVRSGPSTGYSVVEYLKNGTRVEILEEKIVGTMVWGKISSGWISLDYVVMDPEKEETVPPAETEPPATEPPATEPPATEPPATEPPATEPPATEPKPPQETPEDTNVNLTGTVKVSDSLRVRSGPSTSNSVVGYLKNGQKVTITEKTTSGNMTWGKVSNGWISLDYIVLDAQNTGSAVAVKGTVKVSDLLRVRSGPGTSYAISAFLSNGTKVEIKEQKTVNGTVWGRTDKGWISLDYVVLEGQSAQPQKQTKTVTADCLRVRSAAGTSNRIVGYLYRNTKVEIFQTVNVGGVTWGQTSKGWISMEYVK